jgi:DNA-binding response OmpR family regulator
MDARILVINDTQEILDLFRELLEEEGYEVVLYSYAILEMGEVEKIMPNLIILDYVFGTENTGWQMLQKLKMVRATATIPVIICTAATREVRDIQGYLQAQGIRLVPKPFNIDDLLATVKLALQDPHYDAVLLTETAQQEEQEAQAANHVQPSPAPKRPEARQPREGKPGQS